MSIRVFSGAALALVAAFSLAASSGDVPSSGTAIVEAKSLKDGTVTMGGSVYRVAPTTRILDEKGHRLPLTALPVAKAGRDDGSIDVSAAVYFEASEAGSGWVLDSVQVVGELPR